MAILIVTGLLSIGLMAQTPVIQKTELSNGGEFASRADGFLAQLDRKDMPGCAVGAIKDGSLVYKRAFGMANLDYDVPNTPTTLFNLASSSKPFTAASIVLLSQQGKLSLDDDIRKFVPEMPKYADTVTIRHLLNHTSGIREYEALVFFSGRGTDNAYSEKDILNMLARQKNLSFTPGSKYQYSNSNYQLLGTIVARVSGKSLRDFADENIFKPLGMKNTRFFDNRFEVVKNRASGYMVDPSDKVRARSSLFDLVGGGGLLSSVEDLALWNQNFFDPKVGGRELVQLMQTPGSLNNGEKIKYGFGLFLGEYKGLRVIKHSGNMAGYRSQIATYPEQKFTAIALCNNSAILPSTIVAKLADIYLDGQFPTASVSEKKISPTAPQGTAIAEKDATRYAGIFANSENSITFRLTIKDGKLVNSGLLQTEVPVMLTPENHLLVVSEGNTYEMAPVFDKAGTITEVKMLSGNGRADGFLPVKPPLDSLAEYIGTYHSDEFDADHKISPRGNSLILQMGPTFEAPLTPVSKDVFTTANGQISVVFARDDKGKITGFVFNSAVDEREVKGVVFDRR